MGEYLESVSVVARPAGRDAVRGPGWRRLFATDGPESALREIVSWIDPAGSYVFTLDFVPGKPRPGARSVAGRPAWCLRVAPREGARLLDRVADVLEAWRAAREELGRSEARLEARTRELDLLQELGRCAAECQDPEGLFRGAARVLHRHADLDAIVVVDRWERGGARARAFLGRPLEAAELERLARRAGEPLGLRDDEALPLVVERDVQYDEAGNAPAATGAGVELPLLREGRPVACMGIVPAAPPGEGARRLFYGAAAALSLHLERILAVQEAERGRFRATLDSMPQAVFLTDRDLAIVRVNRSAEELSAALGLAPGARRLRRIGDLELRDLARDVLRGVAATADGEATTPDERLWSVTLSGVRGAADEALVIVVADVTERRRLQDQLAQAEKLSSLGRMISGVAHELNNPLASIVGFAQLLRGTRGEGAKLESRLEVLDEQARRCQKIVGNLLSFARGQRTEPEPFALNEAVESVVALLRYQLKVEDVELSVELDRSIPAVVGDRHQLQQALVNLVTNAQHAIRGQGRGGAIRVRTLGAQDETIVEVDDDGPGIPESLRSRIFDPFFTTKQEGQGTGLGLSLVYGIVRSHGGRIEVDSREGDGSTFRIRLPRTRAVQAEAPRVATAPRAVPAVEPARILVIDDEPRVAELIRETLGGDGHQVLVAGNGREALERLARERFDLVISDVRMPVMGGRRLLDELRRHRPELARRLVLTTGDTLGGDIEDLGLPVLCKPFDLDELRRVVQVGLTPVRSRGRGPCVT